MIKPPNSSFHLKCKKYKKILLGEYKDQIKFNLNFIDIEDLFR